MIITCSLAGCATFSIDRVKYYNEIVATVGEKNITRADLLSAYNSYGYTYFASQSNQSEVEAMNSTLDILIDRELLYQYALDNDDKYRPSAYQVNEAIQSMFDTLEQETQTYVNEAKDIFNIESSASATDETEEEETAYLYEDYKYKPRAKVAVRYYQDASKKTISSTETEFKEYYIEYITEDEPTNYETLIDSTYLNNFNSDEVIDAMVQTGQLMSPLLKETSQGGLATTKCGILINRQLKDKYFREG